MAGRQYKNSKMLKKSYTFSFSTADLPRDKRLTRTLSDNSNLSTCKEIAAMASFSIQDLLGLSNDSGRTNGNVNGGASSKSEDGFAEPGGSKDAKSSSNRDATTTGNPTQDTNGGSSTAAASNHRRAANATDEETLQEREENTQLVTVEVRTVHASRISRSSSRKRKRTGTGEQGCKEPEQRDSTPESDGKLVHVHVIGLIIYMLHAKHLGRYEVLSTFYTFPFLSCSLQLSPVVLNTVRALSQKGIRNLPAPSVYALHSQLLS